MGRIQQGLSYTLLSIMRKPLNMAEMLNIVLEIQIEALSLVVSEKDLDKWKMLLDNYQSSVEEMETMAERLKLYFKKLQKPHVDKLGLLLMDVRWFNTIKSTLYYLEEEFLINNAQELWKLWDILFDIETQRGLNFINHLNIKES